MDHKKIIVALDYDDDAEALSLVDRLRPEACRLKVGKELFVAAGPRFVEQIVHEAVVLDNPAYHLPQVSSTFHGRDIFAPAGAHLARGVALHELGTPIDPAALQPLDVSPPVRHGSRGEAHILHVDHFGNLITSIPLAMVPELFSSSQVQIVFPQTHAVVDRRRRFFADGPDDGQPFIYSDSSGYVGIAVRNGHAATLLNAGFGAPIAFFIADK